MTEDITDEDITVVESAVKEFTNKDVIFVFGKKVDENTTSRMFDAIDGNRNIKYVIRINEYDENVAISHIRASEVVDQMSGLLQIRETK